MKYLTYVNGDPDETNRLNLARYEALWREGNGEGLFDALAYCFSVGAPVPKWVKRGFLEGWRRYGDAVPNSGRKANVVSLGGAFGIERGPGKRPSDQRRAMLKTLAWQKVKDRHPKDAGLFEAVAEEMNREGAAEDVATFYRMFYGTELPKSDYKPITASAVRDWYYEVSSCASRDSQDT